MAKAENIQAIERATGRSWDDWLQFMERAGAAELNHKDIASKVTADLEGKIDSADWWAQGVTVAYEQHIGRRVPGQRQDGTFEMSVSRSTQLGMQDLMDQWTAFATRDEEMRALTAEEPRVSGTDKRINWRAKSKDGSEIRVTSEPKKNGTASIIATHSRLQTRELNAEAREQWAGILERFLAGL